MKRKMNKTKRNLFHSYVSNLSLKTKGIESVPNPISKKNIEALQKTSRSLFLSLSNLSFFHLNFSLSHKQTIISGKDTHVTFGVTKKSGGKTISSYENHWYSNPPVIWYDPMYLRRERWNEKERKRERDESRKRERERERKKETSIHGGFLWHIHNERERDVLHLHCPSEFVCGLPMKRVRACWREGEIESHWGERESHERIFGLGIEN